MILNLILTSGFCRYGSRPSVLHSEQCSHAIQAHLDFSQSSLVVPCSAPHFDDVIVSIVTSSLLRRSWASLLLSFCTLPSQFPNHGLRSLSQCCISWTLPQILQPTANASGLTPFSINDTQSDKVLRSRCVFCRRALAF